MFATNFTDFVEEFLMPMANRVGMMVVDEGDILTAGGILAWADLGLTLDLAQLDVLMAVRAPEAEFGTPCDQTETMVSTVASRLGIDPSRASRVTSDLIRQGLVRRAVSQQDARRSVLELTEEGARLVSAVRT